MAKVWSSLDKLLLHHSHRRIECRRSTSHILHGFLCDCPGCLQTQTSSHMHHIQTLADWYLLLWYLSGINQRLGLLSSRGEEVLNPCGFSLCVSSGRCQAWRHFHIYHIWMCLLHSVALHRCRVLLPLQECFLSPGIPSECGWAGFLLGLDVLMSCLIDTFADWCWCWLMLLPTDADALTPSSNTRSYTVIHTSERTIVLRTVISTYWTFYHIHLSWSAAFFIQVFLLSNTIVTADKYNCSVGQIQLQRTLASPEKSWFEVFIRVPVLAGWFQPPLLFSSP